MILFHLSRFTTYLIYEFEALNSWLMALLFIQTDNSVQGKKIELLKNVVFVASFMAIIMIFTPLKRSLSGGPWYIIMRECGNCLYLFYSIKALEGSGTIHHHWHDH